LPATVRADVSPLFARVSEGTLLVIQLADTTRFVFATAARVPADALLLAGVFKLLSLLIAFIAQPEVIAKLLRPLGV
jgi:hypothetical protein